MSNNITVWLNNTDIMNVVDFMKPVRCSDCPASICCDVSDCAKAFKDWSLGERSDNKEIMKKLK